MDRRSAFVIFVCSLSTRLLFGWRGFVFPALALTNDSPGYQELAQEILVGRVRSLFRTPGYPLFLALTGGLPDRQLVATLLAQMLLDSVTAILLGWIAFGLTGGKMTALSAGLLWAFCPVAAALAGLVMAETVFIFWVVLGTWSGVKEPSVRYALLQLCCWCLAVLTRPAGLLIPALVSVVLVWYLRDSRQRIRIQAGVLACYAVMMVGWAGVNYERSGVMAISSVARVAGYMYEVPAVEMLDAHGAREYVRLWVLYPRDAERDRQERENRMFREFSARGWSSTAQSMWATVEDPEAMKWMSGWAEERLRGRLLARAFVHAVGGLQIVRPMPPWAPGGLLATALDVGRLLVLPCAVAAVANREGMRVFLWFPWILYALFLPGVNGVWRFRLTAEPVFTLFLAFAGSYVLAQFAPEKPTDARAKLGV